MKTNAPNLTQPRQVEAFFRKAATFIACRKGGTVNRPSLGPDDSGCMYFDTDLAADGKPIWWAGTAWVDATGAVA